MLNIKVNIMRAILCFATFWFALLPQSARGARLLRICVYYNDTLILKGTTSDNGYLSSDQVWELVCNLFERKSLGLDPYGSFNSLVRKSEDGKSYVIQAKEKDKIVIHVDVGGDLHVKSLRLYYVKGVPSGRQWVIDHQLLRKHKKDRRPGW